jgi:class 3 adenylate cyclase
MTKLAAAKRAQLRDSAFAYVDSTGHRRLPIHDESHVRNALARFNQVRFEDEAERDRARTRLLRAARKYGIVPIGFVDGQLRAQGPRSLPSGAVTFLMTDIQDSTGLVHRLGDHYAKLLSDTRRLLRRAVAGAGGREVDARADEFFGVFKLAPSALTAALAIQQAIAGHAWPEGVEVRLRIGLHHGRPTLTDAGYVGLAVHAIKRICAEADGGQILMSRAAQRAIGNQWPAGISLRNLGERRLRGLPEPEVLFEVVPASQPVAGVPVTRR